MAMQTGSDLSDRFTREPRCSPRGGCVCARRRRTTCNLRGTLQPASAAASASRAAFLQRVRFRFRPGVRKLEPLGVAHLRQLPALGRADERVLRRLAGPWRPPSRPSVPARRGRVRSGYVRPADARSAPSDEVDGLRALGFLQPSAPHVVGASAPDRDHDPQTSPPARAAASRWSGKGGGSWAMRCSGKAARFPGTLVRPAPRRNSRPQRIAVAVHHDGPFRGHLQRRDLERRRPRRLREDLPEPQAGDPCLSSVQGGPWSQRSISPLPRWPGPGREPLQGGRLPVEEVSSFDGRCQTCPNSVNCTPAPAMARVRVARSVRTGEPPSIVICADGGKSRIGQDRLSPRYRFERDRIALGRELGGVHEVARALRPPIVSSRLQRQPARSRGVSAARSGVLASRNRDPSRPSEIGPGTRFRIRDSVVRHP